MARTIKSGGRIGSKYYYVYETGEVTSSSDPNIEVGSNVYDDGIRRDPRPKSNRPTDTDTNSCLLYTSPSPRDRTRSRMPSSA